MALGLDEFKEELPQIAKVLAIDDDSITLRWWVGTYTGTWAPWIVKSVEQTISVSSCRILCMICKCDMKFIQTLSSDYFK